jgi:hypothetical protein
MAARLAFLCVSSSKSAYCVDNRELVVFVRMRLALDEVLL